MLITKYPLFNYKLKIKNNIKDKNYLFMLKSGLIRKISPGIFIWLPLGLKIIDKIKNIIKKQMNLINGIELLLPILQPNKFINKNNIENDYNKEIFTLLDRHNHKYILSPTNETLITKIINLEKIPLYNYPLLFYQFQNKFRDEIRPKHGTIRSREFIMKDAYSFHINKKCLLKTYNIMKNIYYQFFHLLGLKVLLVEADCNNIGGSLSHEFHIINKSVENEIIVSNNNKNINLGINFIKPKKKKFYILKKLKLISNNTLNNKIKINEKKINKILKTIIIKGKNKKLILLLIPNNRKLNYIKLYKFINYITLPLKIISIKEYIKLTNHNINLLNKNFLGPIGLKNISLVIIDNSIFTNTNYIVGSNKNNFYYKNFNYLKDLFYPIIIDDIKLVNKSDYTYTKYKKNIKIKNSLEIAHIFQLDKKYTNKFKNMENIYMGSYGIGITRIIPSIIEQYNNNYNSIVWPKLISPFEILILPINMYNNLQVSFITNKIYKELLKLNIDVLLDDRKITPGIMFNNMDLLGIRNIIIISQKNLLNNKIEYLDRKYNLYLKIDINKIIIVILKKIKNINN